MNLPAYFFIILTACNSTANFTSSSKKDSFSSSIGMILLNNYAVNSSVSLPDSVNYKLIRSAADFNETFHMTKASPGTAVVPDFNTQWVAAIILQPSNKVISIDISKAEISENRLNIYYTITDTTVWTTFSHVVKAAVALPKSNDIKQVDFYNNDSIKKTIFVNH